MKAIGYYTTGSVDVLVEIDLPKPTPQPNDLLVEVRAISVNPVDAKIRSGNGPDGPGGDVKVLGWDAAGIVATVGTQTTRFIPGDEVYYAGSLDRAGCYAEFQVVDERIVGRKPSRIGFAEAAALPLTTLTAWEMLFDRLAIPVGEPGATGSLLVVGGGGGVGSIAIQLARHLTGLTVISTASRPETRAWSLKMGAHHVVDHHLPIAEQIRAIVPQGVNLRPRDDSHRRAFRRDRRGARPAGRPRADRESSPTTRHHQVEVQEYPAPLGIRFHPVAL